MTIIEVGSDDNRWRKRRRWMQLAMLMGGESEEEVRVPAVHGHPLTENRKYAREKSKDLLGKFHILAEKTRVKV